MAILDGKRVAEQVQAEVQNEIRTLLPAAGRPPGLAVVIVGGHPSSLIYVNQKKKAAEKLGISSRLIELPDTVTQAELLAAVEQLNRDPLTDAFLVQLPLPGHLNPWQVLERIDPDKDADGFHPLNQGKVFLNYADLFPCTPAGILRLFDEYGIDLAWRQAMVVGRSFIVGKPLALMLANRNATITLCHSKTHNLGEILRRADLIVVATGRPGLITADMVRTGVVLVDVGTNRIVNPEEFRRFADPALEEKFKKNGYVLIGDIDYRAYAKSSFYTPVPGGVGPMTVAMLMANTLQLYKKRIRVPGA